MALCYKDGKGVSKNETETGKWLQKAADGGDYDAMDYLAIGYTYGSYGLPKNKNKAIELYKITAKSGSNFAKDKLKEWGIMY